MKNKGVLVLIGLVVSLAGYVVFDLQSEKKAEEKKSESAALFHLEPDQVNEVVLEKGGRLTRLQRDKDGWRVVEPLQDWADNSFTEDFVAGLLKEKSTDIAKEGESVAWKTYGLDVPLGKITFKDQSGKSESLEVGTQSNFEGSSLARRPGGNQVLVVGPAWQSNVQKEALDFRDKKFFRGKLGGILEIEVKTPFETFKLVSKDGQWTAPAHSEWPLDQNRVRELLSSVNETRVADFLLDHAPSPAERKKFEIEKPAVKIIFKQTEKSWMGELALNKAKETVAVTSDPAFVLKMESGQFEKFQRLALGALRDKKRPFAFEKAKVAKVDIRSSLKKATFEKKNGAWVLVDASPDAVADDRRVQDLVDRVRDASALKYLGASAAPELERPEAPRLLLSDADGKPIFELRWSMGPKKETVFGEAKTVYVARTSASKEILWIEDTTISSWNLGTLTHSKDKPPESAGMAQAPGDAPPSETR